MTGKARGGASTGCDTTHTYDDIISVENLLAAWTEFLRGKRGKKDVQEFQHNLIDNIFALHIELKAGTYRHGGYHAFNITDPKPRQIHKAAVRDRLVHHALYRRLYPAFDRRFIADSYSCRVDKGTHRAMRQFKTFSYKASRNNTRTCWVLKCDIRKCFASINQAILVELLRSHLDDQRTLALLREVIGSFGVHPGKGLPLGNLTSQLLVNVYLHVLDQYAKQELRATHYIRYADDFVILSTDRQWLVALIPRIARFLKERLSLELHPRKVVIRTLASGVDFLGWVHFPDHRVLRTTTKRRMLRNLETANRQSIASYRAMLSHGNAQKLLAKFRSSE